MVNDHETERRQKRVSYFAKLCTEAGLLSLADELMIIVGDNEKLNNFYHVFRKWVV